MEHSNAPQQTHNQNISSEQNNSEQQQQQHNYRKGSPNHHLNSSTSSSSSPSHSTSTRMVADHHQLLLQPQLPSSSSPSSSTSSPEAVTIEVVYELASTIGEEFKRLLELHGEEETALTANNSNNRRLVPTVVRVLELLEEAVLQREDYQRLVEQQTRTIEEQRVAAEKAAAERKQQLRYLSEIEEVDESWRRENLKLGEYVKYLKGENRRLASSLSEKLTQSLTDLKLHDGLNGDHGGDDDGGDEEKTNSQLTRRISLLVKELRLKADEANQLKTVNEALTEENANLRNLNANIRSNLARRREQEEEEEERRKEVERSCDDDDDEGASINNNHNDSRERYQHLEEKIRSLEAQVELYRRQLKEKNKENEDTNCDKEEEEVEETVEAAEEVIVPMEDLPVQGPIPKEPDFWDPRGGRSSNRTSRILSFFPRLTRALINNSANKTS